MLCETSWGLRYYVCESYPQDFTTGLLPKVGFIKHAYIYNLFIKVISLRKCDNLGGTFIIFKETKNVIFTHCMTTVIMAYNICLGIV